MENSSMIKTILDFDSRLYDAMSLKEYKSTFEEIVAHREELQKEVAALTILKIIKIFGTDSMFAERYRNERKETIVSAAVFSLLRVFVLESVMSYGMNEDIIDVIRKYVDKATQESIDAFIEARKALRRKQKEFLESRKRALTDPQTLEEFAYYFEVKEKSELSPELLKRYDDLILDKWKDRNTKDKRAKEVSISERIDAGFELKQTVHSREGYNLFVIVLEGRVDRERFNELLSAAKKLGGWYSSYSKDGAIPGFQFKKEDSALAFGSVLVGGTEKLPVNMVTNTTGSQKLHTLATEIIRRAEESLNVNRKTNTHRRAEQAEYAEANARIEIALGETMLNISQAIENNEVYLLKAMNSKILIEQLLSILRRAQKSYARENGMDLSESDFINDMAIMKHVRFPYPSLSTLRFHEVLRSKATKAEKKNLDELATNGDGWLEFFGKRNMELFQRLYAKLPSTFIESSEGEELKSVRMKYQRMINAGIHNESLLRSALRELLPLVTDTAKADPIKTMIRSLIGRKIPGYFPTPKALVERMLLEAEIEKGMSVLEPSAGKGDIADVIRDLYQINPDVVEINSDLRKLLTLKCHKVIASDFMELEGQQYDRIIMNPPFEGYADVKHLQHAFSMLKPNGVLVAIMAASAFQNTHKIAIEFRDWIVQHEGKYWQNPEGAFMESDRQTGVASYMLVIRKNQQDGTDTATLDMQRSIVVQGGSLLDMMRV